MKKIITLTLITLLCSCSASFDMGKKSTEPEVTKADFAELVKQSNAIFATFDQRLKALEPKKAEQK